MPGLGGARVYGRARRLRCRPYARALPRARRGNGAHGRPSAACDAAPRGCRAPSGADPKHRVSRGRRRRVTMRVKTVSVRSKVLSQFEQVAKEQNKVVVALSDDLVRVDWGLDSLCLSIFVVRVGCGL